MGLPIIVTTNSPILSEPSLASSDVPVMPIKPEPPLIPIDDIFSTMPSSGDVLGELDSLEDFLQMQTDFKIEPSDPQDDMSVQMMDGWSWDKPLSSVNMDFDFEAKYSIENGIINAVDPHLVVRGPSYGILDENANTGFGLKAEDHLDFN